MASSIFTVALILILIATGGYIVFIIKQQKVIFRWSYRILLAGFVFHTVYLVQQYYELGTAPVLSLKSSLSFFAWTITGAYLFFQQKYKLMVLGSFIAPLAAILMIASSSLPRMDVIVKPIYKSVWLTVHVGTIFIGNGMFALAFAAAIMYLIQEHQIKKKRLGYISSRLPSLETLDSINYHSLMYGFPFLTLGMITGSVYAQYALGAYWQWDPKEVWSLITWLLYAALLHERLAVGWRGRRAALMSILGFAMLIFTFLGASFWLGGYHSFRSLQGI